MPNPADDRPPQTPAEETHITLMQKLLEATLMRREGDLSDEEWQRLRSVAGDAQSRAASTVEFVESLIWALCELRFPVLAQDAATCKRMCHRIAATLSADPYARKRLAEFQNHLLYRAS